MSDDAVAKAFRSEASSEIAGRMTDAVELVWADANTGFAELTGLWRKSFANKVMDLSLSPEWTLRAAESAGLTGDLRMVGFKENGGTLRAFTAFFETVEPMFGLQLSVRELPGNRLVAYHNEIPGDLTCSLIDKVVADEHVSCDAVHLPAVPRGGLTDLQVISCAQRHGWTLVRYPGSRSPYIRIDGTWNAFLKSMSSNFRYNLKRKRRALEKHGRVSERWFRSPDSVDDLLNCISTIESVSWKVDANMAITASDQEESYYRTLLPWLASIGALSANVVFVNDTPVAYSLCYRWQRRVAQAKTSFDERFSDASPGLVVNASAIQDAFDSGASEFDFLGDIMPHKMHWTSDLRPHDDLLIFTSTVRGRLVGTAKWLMHRLRPHCSPVTAGRGEFRTRTPPDRL